jgi:hypothetical protein
MRMSSSRSRGLLAVGLVVVGVVLCAIFGSLLFAAGVQLDESGASGLAEPSLRVLFLGIGAGFITTIVGAVIGFRELGILLDRRRGN